MGQDKQDSDRVVIGDSTLSQLPDFATITGTITDHDNNPIDGASILVEEKQIGTTSDAQGNYILTMAPGSYTIRFSYLGREPVIKEVRLYSSGELNAQLRETALDMEEIIVEGNQYDDNVGGVITGVENVTIREMEEIPVLLGEVDVVNTLKLLPGVSTVGEGASGFNVRGGRTDQNLVLMNGAHLFNSSHVIGLFSVFNPDIIESFTLFKGHIPARYGGKLSSVLDVKLRDGNFEAFKLQGGVGIAASRLTLEGPIGDNTSYLAAGRLTYSDWVLGLVKEPDISGSEASFYDTNIQLTHRFNDLNTASLSYYRSYDDFQFSDRFGYSWGSRLLNFKWTSVISDKFASSFSAVHGSYSSSYYDPSGVDSFNLENGIDYINLKENILYDLNSRHSLNAGLEWNYYDGLPETVEPYNEQSTIREDEISKEQGREMAAYISDDITLGELQLSLGLRYSLYQNLGPGQVFLYEPNLPRTADTIIDTTTFSKGEIIKTYGGLEPRISARFNLGQSSSVKMSYNINRQYNHSISNSNSPTPSDIRQVSNRYIPAQTAYSYSAGYFKNFKNDTWESSVQLYYKDIDDLVEYRNFAELYLNEHLETELLSGSGKSYGLELNLEKTTGSWTGWLAYSYARTFVKVPGSEQGSINNGEWFPSSYDQPHSLSLVAKRRLGEKSAFAVNLTYKTGRPITAITSSYNTGSTAIPVFSERNEYRIPNYFRVDISFTVAENIWKNRTVDPNRRYKDSMTIAFYNIFSRDNAFSVFYRRPEDASSFIPKAYKLSVLGAIIPSITYNFSF